jgi:hypothetical protein
MSRNCCETITELLSALHNNRREKILSVYLIYYIALHSGKEMNETDVCFAFSSVDLRSFRTFCLLDRVVVASYYLHTGLIVIICIVMVLINVLPGNSSVNTFNMEQWKLCLSRDCYSSLLGSSQRVNGLPK